MDKTIGNQVKQLLDEHKITWDTNSTPYDYLSLRECVLQIELNQEIKAIEEMIRDLSSFEKNFKFRCVYRELDTKHTIPFVVLHESPTNQLYWKIAQLVFEPQTMKDMLSIVLPSIRQHLKADLNYVPVYSQSLNREVMRVQPTLELLGQLDKFNYLPPTYETLSDYVWLDNILFDIKDIELYSLSLLSDLHNILTNNYPGLAKRLYAHNTSLQVLSQDILKSISPKSAIGNLIQSLALGGETMTRQTFANESATEAIVQFCCYFNGLPSELKEQLEALPGGNITLGDVIKKEILTGQCIETIKRNLNLILQQSGNSTILHTIPEINPFALKETKEKYGPKNHLNTKKDSQKIQSVPNEFIRIAIGRILISTFEELINLTMNFSPDFYSLLWINLQFNVTVSIEPLASMIREGAFDQEQKQALASAIVARHRLLEFDVLKAKLIIWAIATHSPICLMEVLNYIGPNKIGTALAQGYDKWGPIMHFALLHSLELFKLILGYLPEDQIVQVLRQVDENGDSILHVHENDPLMLNTILELLPLNLRLAAIKVADKKGNTLLHNQNNPKVLQVVFDSLPQEQWSDVLMLTDKVLKPLLHIKLENPEIFQMLLERLLPENRLAVIRVPDAFGKTLLREALKNPELFLKIVELLPLNHRICVVTEKGLFSRFPTDSFHPFLKQILELLPEVHKLEFLKNPTHNGSMLEYLVENTNISSTDKGFEHSFVPELFTIYKILAVHTKNKRPRNNSMTFLRPIDADVQLLNKLLTFNSFEDIKRQLIIYAHQDDTPLCGDLFKKLTITDSFWSREGYFVYLQVPLNLCSSGNSYNEIRASIDQLNEYNNAACSLAPLKVRLAACPEAEKLAFLKQQIKYQSEFHSILSLLADSTLTITSEEKNFQDSFVTEFIALYRFLSERIKNNTAMTYNSTLFHSIEKPQLLLQILENGSTFEEIKWSLKNYIFENPLSPLTQEMSKILKIEGQVRLELRNYELKI